MIFSVRDATFAYPRRPPILKNISLTLVPGELTAILGPNGVGKTTLLRAMTGLQKWKSGASYLNDMNIASMKPADQWKRMAYVPQARSAASLSLTGLDMVMIGRSAHLPPLAQPTSRERTMAEDVMAEVGITHLGAVPCGQMSGGQFQLVLIARALVGRPEVLVLDEPETGLDFRNQLIVLGLLDSLVHTRGISAVTNTHYPGHALRIADGTLLLNPDGTSTSGPTRDVMTGERLGATFGVDVLFSEVPHDGATFTTVHPLSIT